MKLNKNFLIITVSGILLSSCEQKYQSTNNATDQKNIPVEPIEETKENVKDDLKAVNEPKDNTNQKVTEKMTTRKEYQPLSDEELRKTLTPLQYQVTKHEATERPWTNKFDKHFEEGIYVCITFKPKRRSLAYFSDGAWHICVRAHRVFIYVDVASNR